MGAKAIDPQSIRNVTLLGDPADTARVAHHLLRGSGTPTSSPATTLHWATDGVEHTIRLAELSTQAPVAALQRAIRVADGVIAVVDAATNLAPRLETMLRVADDHQVARLCLITGLDHPDTDFDRCIRTIADTRGAVPLPLQLPIGTGTDFEGVIDLISIWALAPLAAEIYGPHWQLAEQQYRTLVATVIEPNADPNALGLQQFPLEHLHHRIRHLTRIGDIAPILCSPPPAINDPTPLLDAITRYLPSPLTVCQPEHALDY
ncbi:GTP-binding protein [Nocardia sp. CA-151230]|uniref:GTP-binding protein n=1 Tax=Nocardia sp. CA-151230 TaxID=3239982 RepID=UPI003D94485C